MKDLAINKIRTFGKVGYTVTVVAKVFLILGLVLCIAAAVALVFLPKDFIKIGFDGKAKITVNMEAIGETLPKNFKDELDGHFKYDEDLGVYVDSNFEINGNEYEVATITADGNTLNVEANAGYNQFSVHRLWLAMFGAVIKLLVMIVVMFFAGSLCKAFRDCNSPFEAAVINKMHNLGFSMIPMAFISELSNSFMKSAFSEKLHITFGIDLSVVIAILLVFALAYIFKYGAVLQQESDETL